MALGLQQAGYEVKLVAPVDFEDFVTWHGITYAPIGIDLLKLMRTDQIREMQAQPIRTARHFKTLVIPMFQRILDDTWSAAQGSAVSLPPDGEVWAISMCRTPSSK